MKEMLELSSEVPDAGTAVVSLPLAGVDAELREVTEHLPDIRNTTVGGKDEPLAAPAILKDLILTLRRILLDVAAGLSTTRSPKAPSWSLERSRPVKSSNPGRWPSSVLRSARTCR
ncbi:MULTISPECIES: hypothetical protein [unclassified Bradyrhizobium]|uniref:hypothetical protein n=1 Tax=unclassified Bradyrhizobium TaxID=2631580 RepID=UPI00339ACD97